ncbi:SDR family oxidoreductase [Myxococcota bacterium]|nr:SDR family oxidoreductase [Myxococcota bacterium]MBU1412261.1 SDR family oxidoreductase [Myxococcota bacterium]MBU1510787.1 SDR family oxidoreductase [Myxococcota bacterium]
MSSWNSESPLQIVVMGATGPLGSACTLHLAAAGHAVACVARNGEGLALLQAGCPEQLTLIPGDLTHPDQRGEIHAKVEAFLRPAVPAVFLFVLGDHRESLPGGDEKTARELVEINLTLPMLEALHWAPRIAGGQFVFFADATVASPGPGYHAYSAAKAGLAALTRTLAQTLAPAIRVNAVAPGILNLKPTARPDARERWSARIPLHEIGEPHFIAMAVEFLIRHPYLTGVVLPVDGGYSLHHH